MLDALERSMGALDASVHAQRQLVADASHELRTPVTSLRTNIEILQQAQTWTTEERRRLLSDVVEQIEELTLLMNDLIDLARGEEPRADAEDVRLDSVVGEVVDRARTGTLRRRRLHVELEPTIVAGVPARLERAVSNLIDNAVKYSPPGEPVEIRAARRGADRARPRTGDLRRGPAARVRSLLPRRRGPRRAPARGWGLRSCARSSTSRAGASRPSPPPAAARSCGCACPAPSGHIERRPPEQRGAQLLLGRAPEETRGREAVAAAERTREVGRLPIADEARDVAARGSNAARRAARPPLPSAARADPRGRWSRRTARKRVAVGGASWPEPRPPSRASAGGDSGARRPPARAGTAGDARRRCPDAHPPLRPLPPDGTAAASARVAQCDAFGRRAVGAAEQQRVHQQGKQLVELDPLLPAAGQRRQLLIGGEHAPEGARTASASPGPPRGGRRRRMDRSARGGRRRRPSRCPTRGLRAGAPAAPPGPPDRQVVRIPARPRGSRRSTAHLDRARSAASGRRRRSA